MCAYAYVYIFIKASYTTWLTVLPTITIDYKTKKKKERKKESTRYGKLPFKCLVIPVVGDGSPHDSHNNRDYSGSF